MRIVISKAPSGPRAVLDWRSKLIGCAAASLALFALAVAVAPPRAGAQGSKTGATSTTVELIFGNLPPRTSQAYRRLRSAAGGTMGQMLAMTKSEVWIVPAGRVAGVTAQAKRSGVRVTRLDGALHNLLSPMAATAAMSPKQSEMMAAANKSPSVMGVAMMSAQPANTVEYALTRADADTPVLLAVADKTSLRVIRQSLRAEGDHYVWRGVTVDTNEPVTVLWWSDGRMAGNAAHKGMMYVIKNMGAGATAVVAMDADKMPTEHAPMTPMRRDDPMLKTDTVFMTGDAGSMRPRTAPAPTMSDATAQAIKSERPIEITIMVAYTKKAASHYMDIRRDLIPLTIDDANQSFRNSGIGHISLRLVHTHETDYDEGGAIHFDHVWRMADKGDGFMEEIPRLRDEKKADIVVLIVDDASGCGLATRVAADAEEAYAVVHHECAATSYSLAHEVGHILGARHDRSLDTSTGPFPFGHGFVNGTKWRTMMSYKSSCNGCPRLPYWSNPDVSIHGEPTGSVDSNNALVLREQAERVARFRSMRPAR